MCVYIEFSENQRYFEKQSPIIRQKIGSNNYEKIPVILSDSKQKTNITFNFGESLSEN